MNSKKTDRRGFLKGSAALAGLAVGAIPFANGKAFAEATPRTPPSSRRRALPPTSPTSRIYYTAGALDSRARYIAFIVREHLP